jgi:SAM-dependent methyltransferase/mannose-6-phosphate isomerase-like protein (cupin superfamily)
MEMKGMSYKYSLPTSVSFTGKGLLGYTFGPLDQKDLDIYYIEVEKGHDFFMISRKITRIYYVLAGGGHFTIDGVKYDVGAGNLVEVPPRVEYCYSGKMTLLAFSKPRWLRGNDIATKWNPDVVGHEDKCDVDAGSWLVRSVRVRIRGNSPVSAYLRLNQKIWNILPSCFRALGPIRLYGEVLHKLSCIHADREQAFSTCFLRNRPELELFRRLVDRVDKGKALNVAVLGCSTGAEAYSVAWRIRSARPDLKLTVSAMDISRQAVEFARSGSYSLTESQLTSTQIFEGMTTAEVEELFQRNGDAVEVRPGIKEAIEWHVGDGGDPGILDRLGLQDLVVANNFICHMTPPEAERCLRNIARLVRPGGYLFVSGIDLDVRTKVAYDLGWEPLQEMLEEVYEGDPYLKRYWPCLYAGLEPLNKGRRDWRTRYASGFRLSCPAPQLADENGRDDQRGHPERIPALSGNIIARVEKEYV